MHSQTSDVHQLSLSLYYTLHFVLSSHIHLLRVFVFAFLCVSISWCLASANYVFVCICICIFIPVFACASASFKQGILLVLIMCSVQMVNRLMQAPTLYLFVFVLYLYLHVCACIILGRRTPGGMVNRLMQAAPGARWDVRLGGRRSPSPHCHHPGCHHQHQHHHHQHHHESIFIRARYVHCLPLLLSKWCDSGWLR